jgi:S1-C subfamily serine protease
MLGSLERKLDDSNDGQTALADRVIPVRTGVIYRHRMTSAPSSLTALSDQLADLVEQASAFVVSVDGRHGRPGSGFICGPDLVVTADHVLERDDHITVRMADRRLAAEIAGRDPGTDVAVLRVAGLGGATPPRSDTVRPGQLVVAVSRTPTAATPAAGLGVVAALGGPLRSGHGISLRQVFRTNASTYPGASGGAILDLSGRVIGMTTSGLLRGLPVVIPSPQLWELATLLATGTTVKRAYLGVSVQPARFPKAGPNGVEGGLLVSGLAPDGAADRGGLMVGDVIVSLDGARLRHVNDLQDRLGDVEAGRSVTLGIVRGGAPLDVPVVTGSR